MTARPGPWLSRRLVRRTVVAVALLACVVLVITPPSWLGATAALLLLVLALCNVLLSRATEQITVSLPRLLDERQRSLRDPAYRGAYWLVAGLGGGVIVVSYLATAGSRAWVGTALEGGPVAVFIALLIGLPTALVAWREPDRTTPAPRATGRQLLGIRVAVVVSAKGRVLGLG